MQIPMQADRPQFANGRVIKILFIGSVGTCLLYCLEITVGCLRSWSFENLPHVMFAGFETGAFVSTGISTGCRSFLECRVTIVC